MKNRKIDEIIDKLLTIDTNADDCKKLSEFLERLDREKLCDLSERIMLSLEEEIPENFWGDRRRKRPQKVWVGVPYLVKQFKIHQRITILLMISHLMGELKYVEVWRKAYR